MLGGAMPPPPAPPPPPPKMKKNVPALPKNAVPKSAAPALPPGALSPDQAYAMAMASTASSGGMGMSPGIMAPPVDPVQEKKEKLENDPDFKKLLKALKMGVPAQQVRLNMRAKKQFDPDDLLMFCDTATIMQLKKIGDYKGNKY